MKCCFSLLLCLPLTIFICSSWANPSALSLVPLLCKDISRADPENVSYDFCVSQLESNPRSFKATAPQLGVISFQLSLSKAKAIASSIEKLLKGPTLNPSAKVVLKDCSELYSDVPADLEAGIQALKGGDFSTANVKVSAVMNAADSCGEGIKKNRDASGLIKMNNFFYQLAAISLGFTKLLPIVN